MCFFCCDMLCWFSVITCCGCRNFVTRKLVFFPPKPYYEHIEPNEQFRDFYHRLSSKPKPKHKKKRHSTNNTTDSDSVILEVGPTQTSTNKAEMTALNSSDDASLDSFDHQPTKKHQKRKHVQSQSTNINQRNFGTFRIKDDDENLANFYWNHFNLKMSNFRSQFLYTTRGETIASYYIKHPSAKYIILFSHGNAADIGLMRNHLCRMYEKCKVSVCQSTFNLLHFKFFYLALTLNLMSCLL